MQLTSSAKGTIAFSLALALAIVYCNTNTICMSEARSPLIPTIGRIFGPLANAALIAPLTLVLIGVVVLGIWSSRRNTYALALVLGVLSVLIYVFAGVSFLLAGSFASVAICAAVTACAVLTTGFAFKGWDERIQVGAG